MGSKYTEEEMEILSAIGSGEFKSVENVEMEKRRYSEYAAGTIRKDKRVNIRISEKDLRKIQRKALEEGIPYQTLISSLLHKYVNGRLVDSHSSSRRD